MDEYLKTLQSINQSIKEALHNPQNSTEEKQFASHLSSSVQLCVDEIFESSNKLKNIVENSLEDLTKAENILQNYFKISKEVDPSVPLEEIGKLSGQSSKILRLIEESRQQVFEKLKESWEKDFEKTQKQWFIDKEGKIKKGIGWNEKESFIKGIKAIDIKQYKNLKQNLKNSYEIIFEPINLAINLNNIQYYVEIIDCQEEKKYQTQIQLLHQRIKTDLLSLSNYDHCEDTKKFILKTNFILDPIVNIKLWDITWDLAINIKSKYSNKIELFIHNIFLEKAELVTSLFEAIIKIYNDFLQKQAFYNQQSLEEQQAKQEWINTQRQKLETLQNSLENVSNFQL